jgi:hypothetical protein
MFPLLAYFASQAGPTTRSKRAWSFARLPLQPGAACACHGLASGSSAWPACNRLVFDLRAASGQLGAPTGAKSFGMMFVAIFAALLLAVVTAVASRAEALNRLIATDLNEEGALRHGGSSQS